MTTSAAVASVSRRAKFKGHAALSRICEHERASDATAPSRCVLAQWVAGWGFVFDDIPADVGQQSCGVGGANAGADAREPAATRSSLAACGFGN